MMLQRMCQSGQTLRRYSDQHLRMPHQKFYWQQQQILPMQNLQLSLQLPPIVQEKRFAQQQYQSQKTVEKQPHKVFWEKKPLLLQNTSHHDTANPHTDGSPLGHYNISQSELVANLRHYIIAPHLLFTYGYPVESIVHREKTVIYKTLPPPLYVKSTSKPDDNVDPVELEGSLTEIADAIQRQCSRCGRPFHVTSSGGYVTQETCTFHRGKLCKVYTRHNNYNIQYTCCGGSGDSVGCKQNLFHVWTGVVLGMNGPYTDFVYTTETNKEPEVYAMDCAMSFTGQGLVVTKVTVIGFDGQLVYEHTVHPTDKIVDYNSRYSEIKAEGESAQNNQVKTLGEVQRDLLQIIGANTILIGHGLENDLRVLKIVHKTVVDTSIVFPHSKGFPFRRSLKRLTRTYLKRDIQPDGRSHENMEDCLACLELMLWKVATDKQKADKWTSATMSTSV